MLTYSWLQENFILWAKFIFKWNDLFEQKQNVKISTLLWLACILRSRLWHCCHIFSNKSQEYICWNKYFFQKQILQKIIILRFQKPQRPKRKKHAIIIVLRAQPNFRINILFEYWETDHDNSVIFYSNRTFTLKGGPSTLHNFWGHYFWSLRLLKVWRNITIVSKEEEVKFLVVKWQ